MESSQNVIFDRAKNSCNWTKDTIAKQVTKQHTQSTISFSDNINFVCEKAISGQLHFVIATEIQSVIPIHSIHKKLLLNNGTNALASEFLNYTDNNKKDFTSQVNWFEYDEFEDMINQMYWISNVRLNQGTNDTMQMNIVDFKKFLNKTFEMHFNIESNNNGNNNNDNNNNNNYNNDKKENKNENNNNSNNNNSKFNGRHQHNFGNMNNKNKKKSKQSTIMEAMGTRFREMVSQANTDDIHHSIKRPSIILPNSPSQRLTFF